MMLTVPHSTYRYTVEKLKRVEVGEAGGGGEMVPLLLLKMKMFCCECFPFPKTTNQRRRVSDFGCHSDGAPIYFKLKL
jgi:hypothetical protein